jgi:hypothetical protein
LDTAIATILAMTGSNRATGFLYFSLIQPFGNKLASTHSSNPRLVGSDLCKVLIKEQLGRFSADQPWRQRETSTRVHLLRLLPKVENIGLRVEIEENEENLKTRKRRSVSYMLSWKGKDIFSTNWREWSRILHVENRQLFLSNNPAGPYRFSDSSMSVKRKSHHGFHACLKLELIKVFWASST